MELKADKDAMTRAVHRLSESVEAAGSAHDSSDAIKALCSDMADMAAAVDRIEGCVPAPAPAVCRVALLTRGSAVAPRTVAAKADTSYVNDCLATKANKSDVTEHMAEAHEGVTHNRDTLAELRARCDDMEMLVAKLQVRHAAVAVCRSVALAVSLTTCQQSPQAEASSHVQTPSADDVTEQLAALQQSTADLADDIQSVRLGVACAASARLTCNGHAVLSVEDCDRREGRHCQRERMPRSKSQQSLSRQRIASKGPRVLALRHLFAPCWSHNHCVWW